MATAALRGLAGPDGSFETLIYEPGRVTLSRPERQKARSRQMLRSYGRKDSGAITR